jgi:hypothetical protein
MGTNYCLHIGKRAGIGEGKTEFIFALPPEILETLSGDIRIQTDYGDEMSLQDFREHILCNCERTDISYVGKNFS